MVLQEDPSHCNASGLLTVKQMERQGSLLTTLEADAASTTSASADACTTSSPSMPTMPTTMTPQEQLYHQQEVIRCSSSAERSASEMPRSSMSAIEQALPPPSAELQIRYYGLALVFLAPALGGFLYGYDIGATSFVLAMLRESRDHDVWWHGFPKYQQGLLVSTLALGALLGSHIVLVYMANNIGRRKEIRIAASLYIVGAMLNVMSGTILAETEANKWGISKGFVCLLTGRLLYGAGVGFIMHGAPTYMAEMSPSHVRGAVVSAKETVIVFGIIVGMLMGDLMSDYPDDWTNLYAIAILGALPMLILTFKIPRSKRWLLMKGYKQEAKESMEFVYKGNVEDEFERMAETIGSLCCRNDANSKDDDDDYLSQSDISVFPDDDDGVARVRLNVSDDESETRSASLCDRKYRRIMTIGLGLLTAQQFSGQPSVLAYSRVLFDAAGWQGHVSVATVTIMGITSACTVGLVDRLGRKILLSAGCVIMAASLAALTFGFWGYDDEDSHYSLSDIKQNVVLLGMFVYIAGYQVGYGPITWTVLSEIYPTEIRGRAMALSVMINFLSKFLCQLAFPIIQDLLGWGFTFILFGSILIVSLLFIILFVPETKGLSLEEIQVKLNGGTTTVLSTSSTLSSGSDGSKQLKSPLLDLSMPQPPRTLSPIV